MTRGVPNPPKPGERFGRWTVLRADPNSDPLSPKEVCVCDCGTVKSIHRSSLRRGARKGSQSCGCLSIERHTTHGGSSRSEYSSWRHMIDRCTNPEHKWYHNYGGSGITVFQPWIDSFERFLADVGPAPSTKHTLDRIRNEGNYEPGNVKWSTRREQNRNKRTNKLITFEGITLPACDWAERLGMLPDTLWARLARGWSLEAALRTPVAKKGGKITKEVSHGTTVRIDAQQ